MKLGVLFSGGKDSVFATYRALEKNQVACLVTLISQNPDSYMFHTPNVRCTDLQAEAMGLPRLAWPTRGEKEMELLDLRAAIMVRQRGIRHRGSGHRGHRSVYPAARVQRIARDLDLWCFNPLWQINQLDYLRLLLAKGFRVIVFRSLSYPFDASWLGAELTEERIRTLADLQKRYKINPSGEGGELETFVLDGPIFKKRIEILKASRTYESYRGRYVIEEMQAVEK